MNLHFTFLSPICSRFSSLLILWWCRSSKRTSKMSHASGPEHSFDGTELMEIGQGSSLFESQGNVDGLKHDWRGEGEEDVSGGFEVAVWWRYNSVAHQLLRQEARMLAAVQHTRWQGIRWQSSLMLITSSVLRTPLSAKHTRGSDVTTRARKIWLVISREYFQKSC